MSCPEFAASVFGMTSSASAKACTPHLVLPLSFLLKASLRRCAAHATWKAPAPGTTLPSTIML
jgi:hypothetical protein